MVNASGRRRVSYEVASAPQWHAASLLWWKTHGPLGGNVNAMRSTRWWGTSAAWDTFRGTTQPSVVGATDTGTFPKSPARTVSKAKGFIRIQSEVLELTFHIFFFFIAASNYQRSFFRKHHHTRVYSITHFRQWPDQQDFRLHHQRYRGRRDKPEHKRKRMWLPMWIEDKSIICAPKPPQNKTKKHGTSTREYRQFRGPAFGMTMES